MVTPAVKQGSSRGKSVNFSTKIDHKYDNIAYCKEALLQGISARKYHYSKKGYAYNLLLHQLNIDGMIVLSHSPKTSILFIGSTETAFSNSRRVHVTYRLTANFYMFRSN